MSKEIVKAQRNQMDRLKYVLGADSVRQQFENALKENSGPFIASIIDLYGSDPYLQKCDANQVVMECLKAATLKLPINKQLGFAYIVPYGTTATFQIGYKGYVQLAMRTGQYRFLNAGKVYEGQIKSRNYLTGEMDLSGEPSSDKAAGYFAYMELINGFKKVVYWTKEEVEAHAKRYSKSYSVKSSAWQTNFDEMALKTVIRHLLSHYGILSVDMISALTSDADDTLKRVEAEIADEANSEVIDIEPINVTVVNQGAEQLKMEGPGF